MEQYFDGLVLVRLIVERSLAAIYLIAFLAALNQFKPLLGEKGLLPAPDFLKQTRFRDTPSIFHFYYSDRLADILSIVGILISAAIVIGLFDHLPWYLYITGWLLNWFLYMSLVNVGRTFFAFGWESMLLEAGFFAAFLGPAYLYPSVIPILILRWMLFRVEFGAGLIKVRHDPCWRDYTCLYYHYETQPMPGPLSWYFHHMPKSIHRFGVAFSHFVQLVVPFGVFAPQPVAQIAGLLIIAHQLWLVFCGNYSWLNWITIILGFTTFSDSLISSVLPLEAGIVEQRPLAFEIVLYMLAIFSLILSWKPFMNFLSKDQMMNYCYNRYHLICVYGAFGSVTKERFELVIEGTTDTVITEQSEWKSYEFKGKPGKLDNIPRQYAPYHLRLDWCMWFLPFTTAVQNNKLIYASTKEWFVMFIEKLLLSDKATLGLLRSSPFEDTRPSFIRVLFYRYEFTTAEEKKASGNIWKRTLTGEYFPPLSLKDIQVVKESNRM